MTRASYTKSSSGAHRITAMGRLMSLLNQLRERFFPRIILRVQGETPVYEVFRGGEWRSTRADACPGPCPLA